MSTKPNRQAEYEYVVVGSGASGGTVAPRLALKFREEHDGERVDGVLYPRGGCLGGCCAHNAHITVYPHNEDWDFVARLTGDSSWSATREMTEPLKKQGLIAEEELPGDGVRTDDELADFVHYPLASHRSPQAAVPPTARRRTRCFMIAAGS